jgi:oligopeptide transport system ATP-binding protein
MTALLQIRGLRTTFATSRGTVTAVDSIDLDIANGETLGIVGESGSGKSQLWMSVMGLLAGNGTVSGSARFAGQEMVGATTAALNRIRGRRVAMIFQNPMTSLNPYLRISTQMTEVLALHLGMSGNDARKRAIEILDMVQIPDAKNRFHGYPHEFSGGMRQRVMIAMALLCEPELLIADEPTTALDVTVQAQIVRLLATLRKELGTAVVMITHNLGVVAGFVDTVAVMYAGRIVETASADEIFASPQHPYTAALLRSSPNLDDDLSEKLATIPGQPPNLLALPKGCRFADRCPNVFDQCRLEDPQLLTIAASGRQSACLQYRSHSHG